MSPMPAATPNPDWNRRRVAASRYRPNRVRLLLIAESPPADAARYFYFDDVTEADDLFEQVAGVMFEEQPTHRKEPFLRELRRRGVYLIDLKPDAPRHGEPLAPYVAPLVLNIGPLAPEAIVLITADVYDAAYRELKKAGLPVVDVRIPWPATGHEVEFRQRFRQAVVRGGLEKLIRPLPAGKREE
jgi:hypothetical protein